VQQLLGSAEARFAAEAVREAGLLVRRIQRELIGASLAKDDKSPVTVADFAAQALVAHLLAQRFPDAVLVGEEQADLLRADAASGMLMQIVGFLGERVPGVTGERTLELIDRGAGDPPGRFWTLDPVDGTKGFLRKDQYAVALALIEHGQAIVAALGCPVLEAARDPAPGGAGSILVAMRGHGAWSFPMGDATFRARQLRVSAIDEPAKARLLRSVEKSHTDADAIDQLAATLGIAAKPVAMDSQAKYAVLAAGGGEILLRLLSPGRPDYREKIWDQAAGSLVVEEAGGRVTDLGGKPLDFSHGRTLAGNRGVAATNGRLHEAVLGALRAIGA
jgi:3'(2'), 5'-bisphosphate nucleotidase